MGENMHARHPNKVLIEGQASRPRPAKYDDAYSDPDVRDRLLENPDLSGEKKLGPVYMRLS